MVKIRRCCDVTCLEPFRAALGRSEGHFSWSTEYHHLQTHNEHSDLENSLTFFSFITSSKDAKGYEEFSRRSYLPSGCLGNILTLENRRHHFSRGIMILESATHSFTVHRQEVTPTHRQTLGIEPNIERGVWSRSLFRVNTIQSYAASHTCLGRVGKRFKRRCAPVRHQSVEDQSKQFSQCRSIF